MTLIELLVAMAIIAVVSIMCVSAFSMILGSEMRETNTRLASEQAEERIAADGEPTTTMAAVISLGGFEIPSETGTYSEITGDGDTIAGEDGQIDISGKRSYTVLKGSEPLPPRSRPLFFGDFSSNPTAKIDLEAVGTVIDTGAVGNTEPYTIPISGTYRLEVWGAKGGGNGGPGSLQGGNGGYATGAVYLTKGDVLHLYAGGAGTSSSTVVPGGFNGGGKNSIYRGYGDTGTGGGASDIRVAGDTFYHRVIVAGGGGGAGHREEGLLCAGGAGGGPTGIDGKDRDSTLLGRGGSQTGGGGTGSTAHDLVNGPGKFGSGGFTDRSSRLGGGGGGGWYGGGAGSQGGAGGGSGWVYTASAFINWQSGNVADATKYELEKLNPKPYLQDAQTVAGDQNIPDPLDTSFDPDHPETTTIAKMTGNPHGGFIRITYLGS
jgi:hypothetical protein